VRVKVYITPRQGILDPQGKAVEGSLRDLGFSGVEQVRVGKYILLDVAAASADEAAATVERMCRQLLANTLLEDYRVEVEVERA
jgi:phosphoribosylformylglycinamidine synthase PurS subunit